MANFDTAAKRFSGMGLMAWDPPLLPIPDGSVDLADRPHFLDLYGGIALDTPTAPPPDEMFDSSIYESSLARDHFPRTGSAFGRSSFGFWLLNPEWRMAWR